MMAVRVYMGQVVGRWLQNNSRYFFIRELPIRSSGDGPWVLGYGRAILIFHLAFQENGTTRLSRTIEPSR